MQEFHAGQGRVIRDNPDGTQIGNSHCNLTVICYNRSIMTDPTPIDISNFPDLLRIAREVQAAKKPRILTRESETIAVLIPVGTVVKSKKKQGKTKADSEALRAAAGSWKDVDTDALLTDIYEDRRRTNNRPPIVDPKVRFIPTFRAVDVTTLVRRKRRREIIREEII